MKTVSLSAQTQVSAVVQGFMRLGAWQLSTAQVVDFMQARIDRGVTTFDTAEIYDLTACESRMGDALRAQPALRAQIQLVSKTGIFLYEGVDYYDTSYKRVKQSCYESLQRLGTDYLDVYLIHREDPCLDVHACAQALLELKQEGAVREIGVSNFDPHKFHALQKATGGQLVTNQIEWNPLCFEHFDSGMMDMLTGDKIHPMIWSPLAGGRLFDTTDPTAQRVMQVLTPMAEQYGIAVDTLIYAWMFHHPVHALPIVGSGNLERLDAAIAGAQVQLKHHDWYAIYKASGTQQIR